MLPEHRIPASAPWCSSTELSAREMMIGHITDANSPWCKSRFFSWMLLQFPQG
jgi:hypothetical protein